VGGFKTCKEPAYSFVHEQYEHARWHYGPHSHSELSTFQRIIIIRAYRHYNHHMQVIDEMEALCNFQTFRDAKTLSLFIVEGSWLLLNVTFAQVGNGSSYLK
jgi:hypothetical protein